ncbi:unnamed protein product [Orchesella dallaii]|uniref:Uncharacterized protein n=1 Tax=Orchesella dallaii TaxID=48710 RepID=A0ABP1S3L2_9HEXA
MRRQGWKRFRIKWVFFLPFTLSIMKYIMRGIHQPAKDYERHGVVSKMRELMEGFEWSIQTAISGVVLLGAVFVLLIVVYLQLFMWLGWP